MKRHLIMLAAALATSPALANPHIHQMPRAPTGVVRPAPITGVGEHPIADNFNIYNGLNSGQSIPTAGVGDGPLGAFRLNCTVTADLKKVDPVAYPGGVSPHLHQFYGNDKVSPTSNYTTLRQIGGSNCGGTATAAVNRSAYWMPSMHDGSGNVVIPYYIKVYYKRFPANNTYCAANTGNYATDIGNTAVGYCVGIPNGLKFIWGFKMSGANAGSYGPGTTEGQGMYYECIKTDGTNPAGNPTQGYLFSQVSCPSGSTFNVIAGAPDCWNGTELDSADHRSHLTHRQYNPSGIGSANSQCPSTHPYLLPHLEIIASYITDSTYPNWKFSSDIQMNAAAGATLHFDYTEAWSPTAKQMWLDNCINGWRSCNNGDLGNGYQMKNSNIPSPVLIKVPEAGVN